VTVDESLAPGEDTGPHPTVLGPHVPEPSVPESSVPVAVAVTASSARWVTAVIRTTRPRQWPKNLLVFAAPLAAASLGRNDGFGYALLAMLAFGCASAAVYFVNDVADVERDRRHPVKRNRPIASGALPGQHAVVIAIFSALGAVGAGLAIREPLLVATASAYLCFSFLYSFKLKHVPYVEMLIVASGFLLRVLGGAAATHVRPSIWFLLVCGLGALGVAIAKRYTELTGLGQDAVRHRPVMRWYRPGPLRVGQMIVGVGMLATYLMWAVTETTAARPWHLLSAVPLAGSLVWFGVLTARRTVRPVEDLILRDAVMLCCEAVWLILFCVGLYVE
jgi:decaprenyl-phosphate phosphoribosyltransferase